jgi:hypothetical protein
MPSPPKSKGTPDDLAEVERALSVLKGRHPEHERVRREDEARRAERQAQIDAEARRATKEALARRLKLGAASAVAIAALSVIGLSFRREIARRAKLEQASDPYRAMGFVVVDTSGRGDPDRLEAKTEPGCLLVVGTAPSTLSIAREGGATLTGPGPALFCTCKPEAMTVTALSPQSGGGLTLLRIDASAIGGSRAFAFLPFKPGTTAVADEACGDAALDAWIDAKRAPRVTVDTKWASADPRRAVLAGVKLEPFAWLKNDAPFVAIDLPKESCLLAASDVLFDRLSLRARGGALAVPETQGPIAYCASEASTLLLQRAGAGEVNALVGPAASVGGSMGLREVASEAGLTVQSVVVPPNDRAWDAKQILVASAVPDTLLTTAQTPDVAPNPDARVIGLSFGTPNALVPEPATDVYSYCEPPLDDKSFQSICIFSGPQRWRVGSAEAVGGLARGKLPYWLFVMEGVSDPVALKAEVDLMSLARRLRRSGFEPLTLEAMTELPNGVEVLGRSGEDAVVAVGVAPIAPYVFPYGDNGASWTLDGAPRIVPLKTLEKVTLTTKERLPPKERRRTVVFRRAAR